MFGASRADPAAATGNFEATSGKATRVAVANGRFVVTEVRLGLPLARRIIVDGLFASAQDPHAYAYRTTHIGFYLAPKAQAGRVHDYRFDEPAQTFFVFDALGDPVGKVFLKEDEWIAGMHGVGELPFHFGGAKLFLATLTV